MVSLRTEENAWFQTGLYMHRAEFTQTRQPRPCKSKLFPDAATTFCNIIEAGGNTISSFYESIVVDIKKIPVRELRRFRHPVWIRKV